ncbi:MAG: pilin [Candidatus Nomurabacteria bacterium]|jgi:type IV secretory pathway VirB2 component (pilin)|nr:pilin [Candidatus Nomurabacteria bacterium]
MEALGWKTWLLFFGVKDKSGKVDVNLPNSTKTDGGESVLTNLLNYSFLFAGIVCVIILVIAGIFYITAGGKADQIAQSKRAIIYSLTGLVVIIMASAIVNFVMGAF